MGDGDGNENDLLAGVRNMAKSIDHIIMIENNTRAYKKKSYEGVWNASIVE